MALSGGSRSLKLSIFADVSNLQKNLKGAEQDTRTFGDKLGEFGKKAAAAFAVAAAAAVAFAAKYGVDAVKAAADMNETISKSQVLFGNASKSVEEFAARAAKNFGQSRQQALDAAATFATFGKSAGLSGEALSKFATDFVGLASDLASFNNTTPEAAIQAIGSALRGEAEPLRKYGVLLDDASMRQAAFEMGLISTTKNALTPQQKVLAAQKLIYEQTTAAQGDFARTSDGLANQQRILSAEITNVKIKIGEALLPAATQLFQFLGTNLMPKVEAFATTLAEKLAPFMDHVAKVVRENVIPILQALWTWIKDSLIPGLQNTFGPIIQGVADLFEKLSTKIVENKDKFAPLMAAIRAVVDFIVTKVAPVLGEVLGFALRNLGTTIGLIIDGIAWVVDRVTKNIEKVVNVGINAINVLLRAWNALPDWLRPGGKVDYLNSVKFSSGGSSPSDTQAAREFASQVPTAPKTSGSGSSIFDIPTLTGGTSGSTGSGGSGGNSGSSDGKTLSKADADRLAGLNSYVAGSNQLLNNKFADILKELEGINKGIQEVIATPTSITIEGVLVDPEGTARAIQELLDDSYFRGGDLNTLAAIA